MLPLAAFADEISPQLETQIAICAECGVSHFELRGVNGINVLDFSPELAKEIRRQLRDAGMGVAAIGSPIGKVAIDSPWPAHLDRLRKAIELAEFFDAPMIRVFSYYAGADGAILPHRQEVVDRFVAKVELLQGTPIVLVHENEAKIFGERAVQCLDLLRTIGSPKLRAAFDFANFVQAGEHPERCWPMLKEYVAHVHIKDAMLADGRVVPAGQGDGNIAAILKDAYGSGYRGFLSLEPHLAAHGPFSGFSGPELFKTAVRALREVAATAGVPLAGSGPI